MMPLMLWAISGIRMHNDVANWLPKDDPQARILNWYEGSFPSEDRILVSWNDATVTDPRLDQIARSLAGREMPDGTREGGSPFVDSVTLPSTLLKRMLNRGVSIDIALDRINGLLSGPGPLRIRFTEAGRQDAEAVASEILNAVQTQFGHEATIVTTELPLPSTEGLSAADEDDESDWRLVDALTQWISNQPEQDVAIHWPGMHTRAAELAEFRNSVQQLQHAGQLAVDETFFTPGSLAAMSVTLSEAGAVDEDKAVEAIQAAAAESGIPAEDLHLGGRPVVGAELNESVKHAGWNRAHPLWNFPYRSPVLFSAGLTILLSLILLRSLRLAVLVQVVTFVTVVASVAPVPLTGGSMNMVLVVMPTLLAVLTTSAAIHLSNYWKHSESKDPADSVVQAANTAWLPCALASGTTSIGLASLMVSNLVPVKDFGLYSAVGCIISFVTVLYLLPSFMMYWRNSPPKAKHLKTDRWRRLGEWLVRLRWSVIAACVLSTAVCGYGLRYFRTETKVIRYFPTDSRLYQDYVFLEDNLSGIVSVDTIVRFDKETQANELSFVERAELVLGIQEEMRQHREVSGTLSLASFLNLEKPTRDMPRMQRMQLNIARRNMEEEVKEALSEGGDRAEGIASLLALPEKAVGPPSPGEPALNAAGDELWRISAQAAILSDIDLEELTGDMHAIAERHLADIESPGTGHVVTGLIPVFLRTQQAVLESLIRSFGMAFMLIAIVMMILLRSIRSGILTMLPNLMPVIVVFGLLSWERLRVDIGTMITASVALGIAVDGTLHLITWFRELLAEGYSIDDAVAGALERCGPAMWQTSAAVGLGTLALLPAELLLISRFGWMLAALIFAALVADIIFLPALLAGPLGHYIQRSIHRTDKASPKSIPPSANGSSADSLVAASGVLSSEPRAE